MTEPVLSDDLGPTSVPWWFIGCGVTSLIIFIGIGVMLFPVVAGILFPPGPPVPTQAAVIEQSSAAYGLDTWTYRLSGDGCEVKTFYEDAGGTCIVEPGHCDSSQRRSSLAATCTGTQDFSRFTMRWEVEIWDYPDRIDLILSREIAWTR
jgi:hypothetical protein